MMPLPHQFPATPELPEGLAEQVQDDFARFAQVGLPRDLPEYLRRYYHLDVRSVYAGLPIANPWGKASGQLSMTLKQVEEDVEAGLGFVVLKTVIAQDATGAQSMGAWAIPEARMVVERIRGARGDEGWTVSWKGRGWWQPFDAYLDLIRGSLRVAAPRGTLIVPSCKYHLPTPQEQSWKLEEYEWTTRRMVEAYVEGLSAGAAGPSPPAIPIEKDFSPTLAGSDRAAQQAKILDWLATVPRLIRQGADASPPLRVGLKLFNALFDDAFQVEMLERVHRPGPDRPDFIVYANRLFDPQRLFEGHRGIAYGGPDLSERNLRVLDAFRDSHSKLAPLEISATGDIHSGKMAVEYLLRGCTSFQLHTYFQLPIEQYAMQRGNRTEKALHMLYFHPQDGLIVWLHHCAQRLGLGERTVSVLELAGVARS